MKVALHKFAQLTEGFAHRALMTEPVAAIRADSAICDPQPETRHGAQMRAVGGQSRAGTSYLLMICGSHGTVAPAFESKTKIS